MESKKFGKIFFVLGFILLIAGVIASISFSYAEEDNLGSSSITIKSDGYPNAAGSYKVKKTAKWVDEGEASITLDFESVSKKQASPNLDLVLVIDTTYSMKSSNKITKAKVAANSLVDSLFDENSSNNRIALITFNALCVANNCSKNVKDDSYIISNFVDKTQKKNLKNLINKIQINGGKTTTYYEYGLNQISKLLKNYQDKDNTDLMVLFLTDDRAYDTTSKLQSMFSDLTSAHKKLNMIGISYNASSTSYSALKYCTHSQYSATPSNIDEVYANAVERNLSYSDVIIEDVIDNNFSLIGGTITSSTGVASANGNKISWNMNDVVTGNNASLTFNVKLNDNIMSGNPAGSLLDTNNGTNIKAKLENETSYVETSVTDSPVIQDGYKLTYNINYPDSDAKREKVEYHRAFSNVLVEDNIQDYNGYVFNGWVVTSGNVTIDDYNEFIMPIGDVVLEASWRKVDVQIYQKISSDSSYTKNELNLKQSNSIDYKLTFKALNENFSSLSVINKIPEGLSLIKNEDNSFYNVVSNTCSETTITNASSDDEILFNINNLNIGCTLEVELKFNLPDNTSSEDNVYFSNMVSVEDVYGKKYSSNTVDSILKGGLVYVDVNFQYSMLNKQACSNATLENNRFCRNPEDQSTCYDLPELPNNQKYLLKSWQPLPAMPSIRGIASSVSLNHGITHAGQFKVSSDNATVIYGLTCLPEGLIKYTIQGDKPDGFSLNSIKYYSGDKITLPNLQAGDVIGDYVFDGWSKILIENEEISLDDFNSFYVTDGKFSDISGTNFEFIGSFTKKSYNVKYILKGDLPDISDINTNGYNFEIVNGEYIYSKKYFPGENVLLPDFDELDGYYFVGWDSDDFVMAKEDKTIIGEFRKNSYSINVNYCLYGSEECKTVSDSDIFTGLYNDSYIITPKTIPGYNLITDSAYYPSSDLLSGNYGPHLTGQSVTFYYELVLDGSVTVERMIKTRDLQYSHGTPVFIFKLSGTDITGESRVYYKSIVFDEETYKSLIGSDVTRTTKSVSFTDLPYGKYSISLVNINRFKLNKVCSDKYYSNCYNPSDTFNLNADSSSRTFYSYGDKNSFARLSHNDFYTFKTGD